MRAVAVQPVPVAYRLEVESAPVARGEPPPGPLQPQRRTRKLRPESQRQNRADLLSQPVPVADGRAHSSGYLVPGIHTTKRRLVCTDMANEGVKGIGPGRTLNMHSFGFKGTIRTCEGTGNTVSDWCIARKI
jgi:hypothetical protein